MASKNSDKRIPSNPPTESSSSLWHCPKCDRPFANINQSHSCGKYTVDDFLSGKSKHSVALFNKFRQMIESCGPVILAPAKTRVGFQVRMIFASVNKLNHDGLFAHLVFARRFEHPRFTKVESFSPRNHANNFIIKTLVELDDEVLEWMRESYKVGNQEHLGK